MPSCSASASSGPGPLSWSAHPPRLPGTRVGTRAASPPHMTDSLPASTSSRRRQRRPSANRRQQSEEPAALAGAAFGTAAAVAPRAAVAVEAAAAPGELPMASGAPVRLLVCLRLRAGQPPGRGRRLHPREQQPNTPASLCARRSGSSTTPCWRARRSGIPRRRELCLPAPGPFSETHAPRRPTPPDPTTAPSSRLPRHHPTLLDQAQIGRGRRRTRCPAARPSRQRASRGRWRPSCRP